MFKAIEFKALELVLSAVNHLKSERGQTSGEYVAVTAVGVIIAIGILYATLGDAIDSAIGTISTRLTNFVENAS